MYMYMYTHSTTCIFHYSYSYKDKIKRDRSDVKMAINQILFIMICLSPLVLAYRPVVLVHGLFGDSDTWNSTRQYILDEHPGKIHDCMYTCTCRTQCSLPPSIPLSLSLYTQGTNITISRTFRGIQSVTTDLWTQVKGLYKEVGHVLTAEGDGAILICYSQGILDNTHKRYKLYIEYI